MPTLILPILLGGCAIILSIKALRAIHKDTDTYKGNGLAIAGLILGSLIIAAFLTLLIVELANWDGLGGGWF